MEKRGAHEMRRAPCSFGTSVETVTPHRKKRSNRSRGDLISTLQPSNIMDDTANAQGSPLRQPKKRFVGRRTADAQAQKDSTSQADVESNAVQKGMQSIGT